MKKKKRERDSERHSEDTQLYRGEKGRKKKSKGNNNNNNGLRCDLGDAYPVGRKQKKKKAFVELK